LILIFITYYLYCTFVPRMFLKWLGKNTTWLKLMAVSRTI
jgi:hypothetical protein